MPNYRSLLPDGYYSDNPYNRALHTSIRTNNPGAINGAVWEKAMPGYVDTDETTPGNKTTIFETPEYGVAAWWQLLYIYARKGYNTITSIITAYGGGQNYSDYLRSVVRESRLPADTVIDLWDDGKLLPFAKAMFEYEAGQVTPLHDDQIIYGFNLARKMHY
jgi:hypothetical protein